MCSVLRAHGAADTSSHVAHDCACAVESQLQDGKSPQGVILAKAEQLLTAAQTLRQHPTLGLTDPAGAEAIKYYEEELAKHVAKNGLTTT
jgi:hypothetical protein